MTTGITLRRYRPADLQAIFRMDQVCFEEPFRFGVRSMRRFAEAPGAIAILACLPEGTNEAVAGFVIVRVEGTGPRCGAYVETLDVAPAMRRKGVASSLMAEGERQAVGAGALRMTLHVFTRNAGAIRTYEGLGYSRMGEIEGFYGLDGDGPLDAFVYAKELG